MVGVRSTVKRNAYRRDTSDLKSSFVPSLSIIELQRSTLNKKNTNAICIFSLLHSSTNSLPPQWKRQPILKATPLLALIP